MGTYPTNGSGSMRPIGGFTELDQSWIIAKGNSSSPYVNLGGARLHIRIIVYGSSGGSELKRFSDWTRPE